MEHEFKPFDKVLHRPSDDAQWLPGLYSHPSINGRHFVQRVPVHQMCIPYEGNEGLLGTKDSPEPGHSFQFGDKVTVVTKATGKTFIGIYSHKTESGIHCILKENACGANCYGDDRVNIFLGWGE